MPSPDEPSDSAVFERLSRLIVEQLDVDLAVRDLGEQTPIFDGGLALDSFGVVELITLVEDQFQVEFGEEQFRPENFADLGTLARIVGSAMRDDAGTA